MYANIHCAPPASSCFWLLVAFCVMCATIREGCAAQHPCFLTLFFVCLLFCFFEMDETPIRWSEINRQKAHHCFTIVPRSFFRAESCICLLVPLVLKPPNTQMRCECQSNNVDFLPLQDHQQMKRSRSSLHCQACDQTCCSLPKIFIQVACERATIKMVVFGVVLFAWLTLFVFAI